MTVRDIWEALLIELSKVNAPSILLGDFNYFLSKSITQYVNKRYNVYDTNQQTTDDLRVLKKSSYLTVNKVVNTEQLEDLEDSIKQSLGTSYQVSLPSDYLHILNCICIYQLSKNYKCSSQGDYVQFPAKKLTADAWPMIMTNYYNRPLPERPYYYIGQNETSETSESSQQNQSNSISLASLKSQVNIASTSPIMEIRFGNDPRFNLVKVYIDYLRIPQTMELTREQIDLIEDTSQVIEFPDYVCKEIINELRNLVMSNISDPRLQNSAIVSQSIAPSVQQQTQQQSQ